MAQRKAPTGCFWRGNTLWGQAMVRGVRKQWSLETDDPKIAKARRDAGKKRAVADVHGDANLAFEEVFNAWEAQLLRAVGPKTAQRYLCSLAQLDRWLEGRLLREIDGRLIGEIISERRSEEHTSELQSLRHLVCRLLLE